MEIAIILVLVFLIFLAGTLYLGFKMYNRAKKRYWELYTKEIETQQQISQLQEQMIRMDQQMNQQMQGLQKLIEEHMFRIQHHLLLEHLVDLSAQAKKNGLLSSEGYDQSFRTIHEMEMDNWQGKK